MSLNNNNGRRRVPTLARLEGNFLEAVLPVKAFATLAAPWPLPRHQMADAFHRLVQGIQYHHHLTVGWIKAGENYPQTHIHAALIAAAPLDCEFAKLSWRQLVAPRYAEAAKVEPYQNGLCGLGYVVKQLGSPYEDVQFSANLTAFVPSLKPHFNSDSAQRRQRRRIQAQLEAHWALAGEGARFLNRH